MVSRRDIAKDREQALAQLYPDGSDPEKLAMMSRTPPHMVMPMLRLQIIEDMIEASMRAAYLLKGGDLKQGQQFITQEEYDEMTPQEFKDRIKASILLVRKVIQHWDSRMIGVRGMGRQDMLEIFGISGAKMSEDGKVLKLD